MTDVAMPDLNGVFDSSMSKPEILLEILRRTGYDVDGAADRLASYNSDTFSETYKRFIDKYGVTKAKHVFLTYIFSTDMVLDDFVR